MRQFLPPTSPYQQQPLPPAAPSPTPAAGAGLAAGTAAVAAQQQQERSAAAGGSGHAHRNLSPECIWLLKMYGRVYLAHADAAASRLELYRFYTDTIILQHVYELVSPKVRATSIPDFACTPEDNLRPEQILIGGLGQIAAVIAVQPLLLANR